MFLYIFYFSYIKSTFLHFNMSIKKKQRRVHILIPFLTVCTNTYTKNNVLLLLILFPYITNKFIHTTIFIWTLMWRNFVHLTLYIYFRVINIPDVTSSKVLRSGFFSIHSFIIIGFLYFCYTSIINTGKKCTAKIEG